MNINIKGSYVFRQNGEIILKGENLITFYGESFFLNRPINNNFNTMKYIVLGNGNNRPRKMDNKLGNEPLRKDCVRQADFDNKRILLTVNLSASELIGTSEIGVANDTILISHDVFDKIHASDLNSSVGEIEVEYSFQLSTSSIRNDWKQLTSSYESSNIYYCVEPNEIIGVLESNTNCGYRKTNGLDELSRYMGAYYYNRSLGQLYIRTSKNSDPNNDVIIVQTK